jgi:hypothetical protein
MTCLTHAISSGDCGIMAVRNDAMEEYYAKTTENPV